MVFGNLLAAEAAKRADRRDIFHTSPAEIKDGERNTKYPQPTAPKLLT